ncbi:TetR/AcrR family transcriptional regulator [Paenibacillus sp. DXFW5]|uniref:TetR/AcrR family transcriptional regulator n=1 Tax=Paenibacillus rhizolycopersici TaxID=2780073 RepID=A0ABS2HE60_9BACL|nr:TetR/AcrR family transcriptional regulator [Paenibacillus rhizolycopersici]MBM6998175.1 TetR/AcrR family transcriptional regulator [Paenibacillus rhizolycopersici]
MTTINSEQKLTKKGKETRSRIVAAAAGLMFERGVAGTSVEDVQKEAKVSSSQLYHYFKEKRELVQAVILFQTEQVLGAQEPLLSHLDSMEALQTWRDAVIQLQVDREYQGGCPIGSLASELADMEPAARTALAACFLQWEQAISQGLRAMHARGEMRADADPDRLALALLTALQGGLLMTQVRKDICALEAVLDAILEHIRSYLV